MDKLPQDVWNIILQDFDKEELINFGKVKPALVNKHLENIMFNNGEHNERSAQILKANTGMNLSPEIYTVTEELLGLHGISRAISTVNYINLTMVGKCGMYCKISGIRKIIDPFVIGLSTRNPYKLDDFKLEYSPYLVWFC